MLIRRRKVRVEIEQTRVEFAIRAPALERDHPLTPKDATDPGMESPTAGDGATASDDSSLTTMPGNKP